MSKTTGCIMKGFMWLVGIASLVYGIYWMQESVYTGIQKPGFQKIPHSRFQEHSTTPDVIIIDND